MNHPRIHLIAQTLCDCDGKDWFELPPADRDRFLRLAIMVDYRIEGAFELEQAGVIYDPASGDAACTLAQMVERGLKCLGS